MYGKGLNPIVLELRGGGLLSRYLGSVTYLQMVSAVCSVCGAATSKAVQKATAARDGVKAPRMFRTSNQVHRRTVLLI